MKNKFTITNGVLRFIFIFYLLINFSETNFLYADDTPGTATVLIVNSSSSGSLAEPDNEDWWQITLPSDGSLYSETNASGDLDIDLYIYDINGATTISSGTKYGSKETVQHLALKEGTYFIRAYRSGGAGSYSISANFTAAPYANDSEPNDSYETAQTLNLNSESTGHISYYQNSSTDYDDYWKVTIPYDGSLTINIESDSADIDLYIYDINGSNVIKTATAYGLTETIEYPNLMPGVYFVRVYSSSSHGGYKITSAYTQTSINGVTANDTEINDEYTTAIDWLTFNSAGRGTSYGHIGYYSNSYTDYSDYWAVTTTTDGKLIVNTESSSTVDIDMYIYDVNGMNAIKTASAYGINEQINFDNLATGKYYIRTYGAGGYGSYKITAELTTPSMANDAEPNDETTTAIPISPENPLTGHLGYYSNNHTDTDDYFVFSIPQNWDTLYVRTDSDDLLDVDLYLLNNSNSVVASAGAYGTVEILKYANAQAGTYYVRAYKSSNQGSYSIKITNNSGSVTGVETEDIALLPTLYSLYQNYPNPFNPETTIKFDIPESDFVTLKIYDVLGNEIKTLVNENKSPGSYNVKFNGSGLASGMYIYKLSTSKFTSIKKLLLVK